jgi:hypothetical protein
MGTSAHRLGDRVVHPRPCLRNMAIEVLLRNENGETVDSIMGVCLAPLIPAMDDQRSACLRFIDPYGDTIFNNLQAGTLRRELLAVLEAAADMNVDRETIGRVVDLVERCGDGTHLYVWFIGD